MTVDFEFIVAFVIGSIAIARATRLFVDDDMPLFKGFREWFVLTMPSGWNELIVCPFCVSIYVATVNVAWAFASNLHWTWWALNLMLAGAYVAAIIEVRDIPPDQR